MLKIILISAILLRSVMDLCFKATVHKLQFDSFQSVGPNIKKALLSPFLWVAGSVSLLNFFFWILVLKHYDLSYAYPLFSICYIIIILGGKVFFDEHLGTYKLIGIGLIAIGTGLLLV